MAFHRQISLENVMTDQPNIFAMPNGGNDMGGGGFIMGALMGRLLFNQNGENNNNQNSDRAAIESAVSSALAQNNQANNNAMLLLKDIQDSSQGVIAAITAGANQATNAAVQGQIASLQGQGNITTAIADNKYTVVNEIHESATDVIASTTANTAQLAATMNTLGASLAAGHAELNSAIQQAKYDNTIATMNDGDKTRAAIALLASQIPNSRELDLQRQLTVALDDHRHTQTRGNIDSGNVSVITNVNQQQAQQQQQQQVLREIDTLRNELQRNTQSTIAIGSTLMGNAQTATNVRQ
jgi:hypothetical protein